MNLSKTLGGHICVCIAMCNLCSEPSATVGGHYLRGRAVIGARWGLPAGRTWRVWRSPPTHGTLYPVSVYIFSLYLCICVKRLMCWGVGEWRGHMKGGTVWLHTLLTPLSTSDLPDFRKTLGGQSCDTFYWRFTLSCVWIFDVWSWKWMLILAADMGLWNKRQIILTWKDN